VVRAFAAILVVNAGCYIAPDPPADAVSGGGDVRFVNGVAGHVENANGGLQVPMASALPGELVVLYLMRELAADMVLDDGEGWMALGHMSIDQNSVEAAYRIVNATDDPTMYLFPGGNQGIPDDADAEFALVTYS
jgi:hypothetical protein